MKLNRLLNRGMLSAVALLSLPLAAVRADSFQYTTGTFTENFDNLGDAGLATTSLTGAGSLPNDGASPWFIGIVASGTGGTAATVATNVLNSVSDGTVAVVNPGTRLFNNGATANAERALGTANTGGDPVIDLKVKNVTGSLAGFSLSFVTEYWRSGSSTTAANLGHLVYYSPTGAANSWIQIPYTRASKVYATAATALDGNLAANRVASTVNVTLPLPLAQGSEFFIRFRDDNDATHSPDPNIALDDVSFTGTVIGAALTYNRAHTVGGAPDGSLDISGGLYFLNGAAPAAFAANDFINFTQDGGANISVPSDVAPGFTNVAHTAGTYTFSGAGKISGTLISTGTGSVALSSANSFTTFNISGGTTVTTGNVGSIGTASITTGTGGATLQTDANLTTTGSINATGALTKTGTGTLAVGGTGAGTGALTIAAGGLQVDSVGALGVGSITLGANTTLTYNTAAADLNMGTRTVTLNASGHTISNLQPQSNVAVVFNTANTLVGSGPIVKDGPGVLRFTTAQTTLTSDWTLNAGAVEVSVAAATMGTGAVTVNPNATLVATGGANAALITNSVTLAGGALGTRTGDAAAFGGTVTVTAPSFINLKSNSTPTGAGAFAISGKLTGSGGLTLTGNIPLTAGAGKFLTLRNILNDYSGTFTVTSQQGLSSDSVLNTGSCLGTASVKLQGGTLRLLEAGAGNNGVINSFATTAISVEDPSSITFPGVATISVGATATLLNTGNTINIGPLTIGNNTLATVGANNYKVDLTNVTLTGSPTFSPTTAPLTISAVLSGGNSITKAGTGTLTLTAANTYTGSTTVNEGTLAISATGSITGSSELNVKAGATADLSAMANYTVASGKILSGSGTVTGNVIAANGSSIVAGDAGTGNLTVSNLATNTTSVALTVGSAGQTSLIVSATDGLVTNGVNSVTLNVSGFNAAPGTYTLVDYNGTLGGTGYSAFVLGTLPNRAVGHLEHDIVNTAVVLVIDSVELPVWTGLSSNEWSTAVIAGAKNWKLNTSATAIDFVNGDVVTFNDTPASDQTIDLPADVSVFNMIFANDTRNYTFNGTTSINGAGGLTKNGLASVTINTTNGFTGPVTLNTGTVSIPSIAASGANSPLGTSNAITFAGGTLEFTGTGGASNRAINVNVGGGTIKTATGADLTLSGVFTLGDTLTIDSTGATTISSVLSGASGITLKGAGTSTLSGNVTTTGILTKEGAGTGILTAAGNTPGSIVITAGTLQIGNGAALGSTGAGQITNNAVLAYTSTAGTITSANQIVGTGTLTKTGASTLVLSGTLDNTYSGATTVSGGTLILSKSDGINSIGGDLFVEAGGIVAYGTTAGQLVNHIPDTAAITINGGTFGSGAGSTLAAPTQNVTDTVGSVTLNSGTLLSGRTSGLTPFTITGALTANDGTFLVQRGGKISANTVTLKSPTVVTMDGGSTTGGQTSNLISGAGGLNLTDMTITMNNGPSAIAANSQGSVVNLGGPLNSTGTSQIVRKLPLVAGPKAEVDLGTADRTITVTGSLAFGTAAEPVIVVGAGGGLVKAGLGSLSINGVNTYTGQTAVEAGSLILNGTIATSSSISVSTGATLQILTPAGLNLQPAQTLSGSGTVDATNVGLTGETSSKLTPGTASAVGTLTVNTGTANLNLANVLVVPDSAALTYDLDTIAASDKIVLGTGTLDIGTGVLDIGDFAFTNLAGFEDGTYTLIQTNNTIVGTLASNVLTTIGGKNAVLAKGDGNTDIVLIVGGTMTPLENWRLTNFGSAANAGDGANTADPDKDGVPNIVEYLFGTGPNAGGELGDMTVAKVGSNLVLTYSQKVASLGEVTPVVETSTTLGNDWVTTGVTTTVLSDDTVTQVIEAKVPISGDKRFLRLRVTENTP